MPAWSISHVFSNEWLWLTIGLLISGTVLAIHRFRGGAPTNSNPPLFLTRHVKTIRLVWIVAFLSGVAVFVVYPSVLQFSHALASNGPTRQMELRFAWLSFFGGMAIASAWGGALVGMLPVFQTNMTRFKRIVLLVLCLLPMMFIMLNSAAASSELDWPVIRSFSVPCWVINGPAVLTGQPLFQVVGRIMRKLRLTSGDHSEGQ
jgi:hypothetical protein